MEIGHVKLKFMTRAEAGANWLSSGGAYAIIGIVWLLSSVFFFTYGNRLGSRYDSPNDGCLLAFSTIILTLIGGAAGFVLVAYPWSIVASCLGSLLLPTFACIYFRAKMKRWRPID